MTTSLPALRLLARELRYRPLPALAGSPVVVTGFDAVEIALRVAVRGAGLEPGAFDPNNLHGAVAKYDLMDVSFDVSPAALENAETLCGFPVLRELGLVESAVGEDREPAMMEGGCLDLVAQDVKTGRAYIRLFLTAETPRDHTDPAVLRLMMRRELRDGYFPRTFVIRDACVTNAQDIWLGKHVWL